MNRRHLLEFIAAVFSQASWPLTSAQASSRSSRVRPSDPSWPSAADWQQLDRATAGQLIRLQSPFDACATDPSGQACADLFRRLKNPYFLGDDAALTQTLGWVGAWTSRPSVYAVNAHRTDDVVAAVNFAREHNLRLVVKGGGHSYQGTSCSADSLLIWTRKMNAIVLDDAFVGAGCAGRVAPLPAVTIGAGAMWGQVYDAVTTKGGRYVQGGGCLTVGVAGLIQSGGFGSFSKAYGLAAASLLEAEIVTANGEVRMANACTNPDLFWAIKGGGGGSFGVVTRLTLRTHDLPDVFGAVFLSVRAESETAFRRLIERTIEFYRSALFNPHWGEQITFRPGHVMSVAMVFQGLTQQQAQVTWQPLFAWLEASPRDFTIIEAPQVMALPAGRLWDVDTLKQVPGLVLADDRAHAPATNVFWASNLGEAGRVLHSYQSAWLPAALLADDRRGDLVDALVAGAKHWSLSLHINKGLAGAPKAVIDAAKDTPMNGAMRDAFALVICAAQQQPAYPGITGREPDPALARRHAQAVEDAMRELRRLAPDAGSYVSESDFFEKDWQRSFWGEHYPRLLVTKDVYDPDGLFIVHHGVGSERWSSDGFTRVT
ncbi:FAD-binding oxidoreductase [Bradyrhizobium sp. LHD-71]|uniref:FAD-dependent oxidoreductase n=1 Tax=Bradyrhizobium sp. LHD-71 TaxID=3072141 RepID=UPI00280C9DD5|nr:FAD-binding oxidoreductase [Bradyrhizobium sp. LHD-71]MDQ8729506.1 FAD-binding oxidoreductase [Bradyrhizobium sp. LHD-71]